MSRLRTAVITTGVAAGTVAGGLAGRALLRTRRPDLEIERHLAELPPEDLGEVESYDGTRISVRAAGPDGAPTLVFVHGFSLDMTTWHEQWTRLPYRCLLFDLRSLGRSAPAASGDLSVRAMAGDVAAVLEAHIDPDRPALLVGHSVGAMAILALAEARPEVFGSRVAAVAVVGSAANDLIRGAMGSLTGALRLRLGSVGGAARRLNSLRRVVLARPGDVAALAVRMTQFGPAPAPELVDRVVALAARASSSVWTDGLASVLETDVTSALEAVRVPVLVLVGEHDRVTPPSSAVALVARLPNARLEVIPGAGHMAMLERPERVNDRLVAFAGEVFDNGGRPRRRRSAS